MWVKNPSPVLEEKREGRRIDGTEERRERIVWRMKQRRDSFRRVRFVEESMFDEEEVEEEDKEGRMDRIASTRSSRPVMKLDSQSRIGSSSLLVEVAMGGGGCGGGGGICAPFVCYCNLLVIL